MKKPAGKAISLTREMKKPIGKMISPTSETKKPVGEMISPTGEMISPVSKIKFHGKHTQLSTGWINGLQVLA